MYNRGARREQYFDLESDPGEMQNLAGNPAYTDSLNRHRQTLVSWGDATADDFPFVPPGS